MTYSTIPMQGEHKEALLDLWREGFEDPKIVAMVTERYPWLYEENPSGGATTWLGVQVETSEIIGCGSAYPRTTYVRDRPVRAGVPSDFAVTRAHRIAGCAVSIQRTIVDQRRDVGYEILYARPNKSAFPIFKHIGYQVLGEAVGYTKPLRCRESLRAQIRSPYLARVLERPAVAATVSALVDLGLATVDRLRLLPQLAVYRAEVSIRADARFDELWSRRAWDRVMGEKTAAYLNWRYAGFKATEYRFFCLEERRSGRLAGYLVYSIVGDKAFIADLFTPRLDETMDHLLLHFAMRMREEGKVSIYLSYFGDEAFGRRLLALQFFRRPFRQPVVLFTGKELAPELAEIVRDGRNWFMPDGELDI